MNNVQKLTGMRIMIIVVSVVLAACSARPTSGSNGDLPEDLAALKKLRKEHQDALRTLETELEQINAAIATLEPQNHLRKLVEVETLEPQVFRRFARIQGLVESRNLASVSSETGGRILSMTVKEGQNVQRGQLIARLDAEPLRKQQLELEKSLELARDIYERRARLWDQQIGSEVEYLQSKNQVERLEKSIETIEHQISRASLYAPISGVVDVVYLDPGETAGPGVPIVAILDTRNVKVVADVPENYLGKVRQGDAVTVKFPSISESLNAKITLMGRRIDPANRTFKIEMDIANPAGLYKPNLLAEVLINDFTAHDVLVISQELVQQEVGGRKFVALAGDNSNGPVARKVFITEGESYDGDVIITSGLQAGDRMITVGARGLTEDERIEIANAGSEQRNNGDQ